MSRCWQPRMKLRLVVLQTYQRSKVTLFQLSIFSSPFDFTIFISLNGTFHVVASRSPRGQNLFFRRRSEAFHLSSAQTDIFWMSLRMSRLRCWGILVTNAQMNSQESCCQRARGVQREPWKSIRTGVSMLKWSRQTSLLCLLLWIGEEKVEREDGERQHRLIGLWG